MNKPPYCYQHERWHYHSTTKDLVIVGLILLASLCVLVPLLVLAVSVVLAIGPIIGNALSQLIQTAGTFASFSLLFLAGCGLFWLACKLADGQEDE